MANIGRTPGGLRAHTVAATVVGMVLLVYALLMTGQAMGLFTF